MKKIVALVLALVLALSLATVAFGATVAKVGEVYGYANATGVDYTSGVLASGTDVTVTAAAAPKLDSAGDPVKGIVAYYTIGETKYVVVAADKATKAIYTVDGWKYLKETAAEYDYKYNFVGTKVGGCYANCVFPNSPATDTTDVNYYSFVNLVDGKTYYGYKGTIDAANGSLLLVGDTIVNVIGVTEASKMYTQANHDFAAASYEKDGVTVATIKCDTCGATAKVATYAEYLAADKTLALANPMTGVNYAILTSAGTTTAAGVSSAKTFDAGVALYAGMALMSVAGSAVVIGKKKEF